MTFTITFKTRGLVLVAHTNYNKIKKDLDIRDRLVIFFYFERINSKDMVSYMYLLLLLLSQCKI